MTGRRVGADEACRLGLISRVVPHDDLQQATTDAVAELLRAAPNARIEVKRIMNAGYGVIDDMTFEASLLADEVVEGFNAFTEKRTPNWVIAICLARETHRCFSLRMRQTSENYTIATTLQTT